MRRFSASLTVFTICLLSGQAALAQAGGDDERGARLFQQCSACHQIGPEAKNRIGPQLNHIFDRAVGHAEDYTYSPGLQKASDEGMIWDYEALDRFIENPRAMFPRTRMSYRGMANPEDRSDLLAWLRKWSDNPQNIPEAAPTAEARDHEVDPEILAIVGDPDYGEYLSGECTSCHQADGDDAGIPGITGWPEAQFVMALHAYKDGARKHQVMEMMAGRLSNDEIAGLAAYFAALGGES